MRLNTAIGALVVSGLAMPAVAQVSDVSLTFEADVPDLIDVNTGDPLGNEAFVVQGGTELLPFSGSAAGGFNDIIASMSLAAELSAEGAFAGSGANAASEFFIKGGNAQSVTTIEFTVTGSGCPVRARGDSLLKCSPLSRRQQRIVYGCASCRGLSACDPRDQQW